MPERKKLFSFELNRIREIFDRRHWFNLIEEFNTRGFSLSQSLLLWEGTSANTWLIADFENRITYDIEHESDTAEKLILAEVWERPNETEQFFTITDTGTILERLKSAQGTDQGFIDLHKRLNLGALNLEGLKRNDLSGAGFGFESVHQDLLIVRSMFREILTSSRECLQDLSLGKLVRNLNRYLPQFYANVLKIGHFEISGENPRETYANLLQEISKFCDDAKESLGHIVAYLSSKKMEQFRTAAKASVDAAEVELSAETKRATEINDDAEKKHAEMHQEFNRLKLELQNHLAEKPISQYKSIFHEQAIEHHKNARFWLGMAGVATGAFVVAFVLLTIFVKFESTELAGTLQNLFTKGFLLSPIYVWLNRSIKNHTAQKHLEVINTHRQNALETFDTFVTAAGDNRETRDAVLLSATDAIFDANQTGYLSTKGSGSDNRSPIQQVIREIIPQKSSTKEG